MTDSDSIELPIEGELDLHTFRPQDVKDLVVDYLDACAHHRQHLWSPGVSGGDHAPDWPPQVEALLRKRLSSKPPASYSFAASEVLRLCGYSLDRAQVRRWAIANHLAHPRPNRRPN
ncbi:MAG TPA: hypothetical protein PK256_23370, partial [Verrucomicrobiota bacterium]|nr:hypothetical protein [Verrucomicrobiota bacterium]